MFKGFYRVGLKILSCSLVSVVDLQRTKPSVSQDNNFLDRA